MVDHTLELEQLICGPSTLTLYGVQSLLQVRPIPRIHALAY